MEDKNLTNNQSVEYYNYRNWHFDNQTYCSGIDHGVELPHLYKEQITLNNSGDKNGPDC